MPTSPHVIRLAGIWEIADLLDGAARSQGAISSNSASDGAVWTRVRLDRLEEEGLPFAPVVCRRFFNRPTNLVVDQPVYLEWTGLAQGAQILLNGLLAAETAAGAETVRIRIDDRLIERNEVHLVLLDQESDGTNAAWPFRECRLLIEER